MRKLYLVGVVLIFLTLGSCPSSGSGSYWKTQEVLDRIVYWAAEFGYNCALANVSREEMHILLRERKDIRK